MHIKSLAREFLAELESQGIIINMGVNEQSQFHAPAGFVPKRSGKLRFVIDLISLNKYAESPVHAFPSSDKVAQSRESNTTHMACVDFPSGYFQVKLHKNIQEYTAFNTAFGRYLILRSPQGLSCSGGNSNSNTDHFFSGLGQLLIK